MIYPLIPVFVSLLGSGTIALGIIEGIAETTASLLKLLSGVHSDKLKKRKLFVLLGYGISGLARPLIGFAGSSWHIVLVRMFDRIGKGIRTSPRDALLASSTDKSCLGKAFGFHRAMDHLGAFSGPLIAILILYLLFSSYPCTILYALKFTFKIALIPGIIAFLIIFFVKETKCEDKKAKPVNFSLKQFDRNFKKYLFIIILFTLGNSSDAFLLFRADEIISKSNISTYLFGLIHPLQVIATRIEDKQLQNRIISILLIPIIWSFFHILKSLLSTPLSSLSDRIGRKQVIKIGWFIYAIVYLAFAFLDKVPPYWQLPVLFLLFAVYAFYYAFTEGTEKAFVADMTEKELHGSAYGLFNFAIGLGALPASIIFGVIYKAFNGNIAFLYGSLIAFISTILLMLFVREPERIT
ncbi:MAG: MFS transporter [Candidatus Coatesbacteria bacterium]|nr:MFS transporter [Candidatus Coatesbacteria bacterium]